MREHWVSCAAIAASLAWGVAAEAQLFDFSNCTTRAGVTHTHTPGVQGYQVYQAAGGAAADFNRDGWTDLFVLGGGGTPDRLFINQGLDGEGHATFLDEAAAWGIGESQNAFGATAADFNNDGWIDIFVTAHGPGDQPAQAGKQRLYRNNGPDGSGQWSFTDVAQEAGVAWIIPGNVTALGTGSAWGDWDLDGDLDLSVCSYRVVAAGNRHFRNNGDGTFTDVTAELGLEFTGVPGFLPCWADMNGDRYPELILIGDTGTTRYYVSHGGTSFTEIVSVGDLFNNAMGVAIADADRDGLLDMYVSGSYYPFLEGPGNQLALQQADGTFVDVAEQTGVMKGGWAWGVLMVDFDHDGYEDIADTNGFNQLWQSEQSYLWHNDMAATGVLGFTEDAIASGFVHTGQGRGLINFDMDNDGDQDMVIFATAEPMFMFRNDLISAERGPAPGAGWVRVELDTSARDTLAPDGFGSRVTVRAGGMDRIGVIEGGVSHCSSGEIGAHFGLGGLPGADAVRVSWSDGTFTTLVDVAPGQVLHIRAPFNPADFDGDGVLTFLDALEFCEKVSASSLVADMNGDWWIDYLDVIDFMRAFAAGVD